MANDKNRVTTGSSNYRGYQPAKKKPESSGCKNCCRKLVAFFFSHIGLCGLVVGYSVMGAFVFQYLEAPYELEKVVNVREMRRDMISKLWDITYELNILYKENWTSLVQSEIREFESRLLMAVKDGYDGNDEGASHQQWSFSGAFLYSLTVITTIGYGDVSPRTSLGKLITILYAVFGIPLMLLYLTNIGDILAKCFKYCYGRVCSCGANSRRNSLDIQKKRRQVDGTIPYINNEYHAHYLTTNQNSPNNKVNSVNVGLMANEVGMPISMGILPNDRLTRIPNHEDEVIPDSITDDYDYDKPRITVPISLCLLILVGYIGGGALLFSVWEGWDYLDGSYFCFMTLSTIRFGDLVPGEGSVTGTDERLVLCSVYLLVGMALIAMCFNLMQEEVIYKVRGFGMTIGIISGEEGEEDED